MNPKNLIALAALAAFGTQAALAASLDDDYAALKRYEFGQDRHALTNIENAALDPAQQAAVEQKLLAVLEGGCTVDAARFICRQLATAGSGASVPALEARAADIELTGHAIRALEAIPAAAAGAALVRLSGHADAAVRTAAVEALGRSGVDGAMDAATTLLGDDDLQVASAAAYALGALGACDVLTETWKTGLNPVALGALVECAASTDDTETLAAIYKSDSAGNHRAAALHGLMAEQGEKGLDLVLEALTTNDAELIAAGLSYVHTLPGKKATEAFAALVAEAGPENRLQLINALAARGDAAAGDAIRAQAGSENETIALAALTAMASVGSAEDLRFLAGVAAESTGVKRNLARQSMNRIQDDGADRALVRMASRGVADIRSEAIRALGARRSVAAKDDLLALTADDDAGIRGDLWDTLAILGDANDLPAYIERLAASLADPKVRDIEQAIADVADRATGDDDRIGAILTALNTTEDVALRGALYRILGSISGDAALTVLRSGIVDDADDARAEAIAALAKRPGDGAKADLYAVAQNPANDRERDDALAGYIRILNESPVRDDVLLDDYAKALELATSTDLQRQILSGVGTVPSKESMDLVERLRGNGDLGVERGLARVQIANALRGHDPAWAREIVEPLAQHENEALKNQANAVLHNLNREKGYLTAWEVSGPYMEAGHTGGMLYDVVFPAETGAGSWRVQPLASDPNYPAGGINLAESIGGFERVAYLRTTVSAPKAMDTTLELGTNDGVKVWVNGELVHGVNTGRPLQPGQDQIPIQLKSGENTILLAVYQHGGDWGSVAKLNPAP